MNAVLILIAIILALFAGAFLSKRRFGLLGLGLTAGAVIAPLWGETAGYVVSATGLLPEGPMINVIAIAAITLIPAVLFMFHGYSYKGMFGRVTGSLLFTVLAIALLIQPLSTIMEISGPIGTVYRWFVENHSLVVSAGVVFAVIDTLTAKAVHKKAEKKHH
jgi:hypothetical protein